jgi:hypothetical protein
MPTPVADVTPVELTPAQAAAQQIVDQVNRFLNAATWCHQSIYAKMWNGAVDPQDICDVLGESAGQIFEDGATLVAMVNRQRAGKPTEILPENYLPKRAATLNEDGTVTLAAP